MCRFVRAWNDPVPGVRDVESWAQFEEVVGEAALSADRGAAPPPDRVED